MLTQFQMPNPELILWDVVEEHLEEAAFLAGQLERAFHSPLYLLKDLARPEERLLAHIDALVVGGPPVTERMLVQALSSDEPLRVQAAAMTLLEQQDSRALDIVMDALAHAEDEQARSAICRAMQLVKCDSALDALQACCNQTAHAELRAAAVHTLGFWSRDLGPQLPSLLSDPDSRVRAAALYAAGRTRRVDCSLQVRRALAADTPEVAAAALEAAVRLGMRDLPEIVRSHVRAGQHSAAPATALWGLLGSQQDHAELLELTQDPRWRRAAVFALGFSGSLPIVEHLVELARNEEVCALATEAVCGILGVDLESEKLLRVAANADDESQDADLDANLSLAVESELPRADPDILEAWWRGRRSSYDARCRYLQGTKFQQADTPLLLAAIDRAPMRRRHSFELALASVSDGRLQLQTYALSRWQLEARRRHAGSA